MTTFQVYDKNEDEPEWQDMTPHQAVQDVLDGCDWAGVPVEVVFDPGETYERRFRKKPPRYKTIKVHRTAHQVQDTANPPDPVASFYGDDARQRAENHARLRNDEVQ